MSKIKFADDNLQSPKSLELESESKILNQLKNGAHMRGRMFYDADQAPFQRKNDMQESLVLSEKSMSMSLNKTGIISKQGFNPYELDNFSKLQIIEQDVILQSKTPLKTSNTLLNAKQINSQMQLQPEKSGTDNKIQIKDIVTQKQFYNTPEKRQTEQQSPPPHRNQKEGRLITTVKNFRIMMSVKRFQDKILKKSLKYVFRKSLEDRIPYQFLNDKTFSSIDYKKQQAYLKAQNYSLAKFLFDVATFFVILVNIIYLPIKHSFNEIFNLFDEGLVEKFTLYFLLLEVFVNISTEFYSRGKLVQDRIGVTKKYLQGRLWIDLIAGIPYLISQSDKSVELLNLFYLIRFVDFIIIFNKIEDKFLKNSHFGDAMKCILLIFFVSHLSACVIHEISLFPKNNGEKTYLDSVEVDLSQWFQVYIYSFYWSIITMTTIGYGDIHPNSHRERIYATFFALLSCVVFGFTLNQIGSIISNMYMNSNQIRKKQAIIDAYLKKRNVTPDLQIRVKKNIEYILSDSGQQNKVVDEILNGLPFSLRNQLKVELYKKILKSIQSFSINFTDPFLEELCTLFQEQTFNQEQYLYYEGDDSDKFYFILRGEVELLYKQAKCPHSNQKNESFGIEEFFSQQPRQLSAKTTRVTTVAYLCFDDFIEVLQRYSSDYEKYRMISDSLNINRQTARIFVKCINCKSISHVFNECPYLFQMRMEKQQIEKNLAQIYNTKQIQRAKTETRKRQKWKTIKNVVKLNEDFWTFLYEYLEIITTQHYQLTEGQEEYYDSQDEEGEDDEENLLEGQNQEGDHERMLQTQTLPNDKNSENTPYNAMLMLKSLYQQKSPANQSDQKHPFSQKLYKQINQIFTTNNKSSSNIDISQLANIFNAGLTSTDNQSNQKLKLPKSSTLEFHQLQQTQRSSHPDLDRPFLQVDGKQPVNKQDQQNYLSVNNVQNKDNISFSFNIQNSSIQKEDTGAQNALPIPRLHSSSKSHSSEKSNMTFMNVNQHQGQNIQQNLVLHSPQLDAKQTSLPLYSPQFPTDMLNFNNHPNMHGPYKNNQEFFRNEGDNNNPNEASKTDSNLISNQISNPNNSNFNNNSKSLSNLNNFSNLNSGTPQQSSYADTYKRKSSHFSNYNKRKTSELKKDEQSHQIHLMPVTIQQSAVIDDSTPSHQQPHGTINEISLLNYNDGSNVRPNSMQNNLLNPSSGQSNINPMSNLQLEPISPIKPNKNENTSPMLTMNKDLFSHSELQFDIQSDNYSPRHKKQWQNFQSPANKLIQAQPTANSLQSERRKSQQQYPSQSNFDDYLNPQNLLQNKSQLNNNGGDSNSVSIKLDDNSEDKIQIQYERNIQEQNRQQMVSENSAKGQSGRQLSTIRKGNTKNTTLLIFGQQPVQVVNSEIDNQFNINLNQNTQGTIISVRNNNDENYNTSQSYGQNAIHETTLDYHPSYQGRKKSQKKTQADIWIEKFNQLSTANSMKREQLTTYLSNKNSMRNIRSTRNIESGSRRNRRQDTVTRAQIQQYADLLSQSQDIPKDNNLLPPLNLKKYQSAKVKSPNLMHQQSPYMTSQQQQLYDQQMLQNKKLVEINIEKIQQNNHHNPHTSHSSNQKLIHRRNSGSHIRHISRLNEIQAGQEQINQSFDLRTQRDIQRKLTNKKISFKTDDQNLMKDNNRKSNSSISNSLIQTQTLNAQYDLRDEYDNSEEDSYDRFSLIPAFDIMKQFNDYFPWNNFGRVMRNINGTKKKRKNDFMNLFGSKQISKAYKTKINRTDRDNSDSVTKGQNK